MKSTLIALGLAAAFMAPVAHSSTLTASQAAPHFSSTHSTSVQATARKGKVQKSSKHAKAKRPQRAAKKA